MFVKDIMKRSVATCAPDNELSSAADIMRNRDCGFLPVVDSRGTVVGVVTDRDVCMSGATAHRPLTRVSVKETMSQPVFSCFGDENLETVLTTMASHHVRRLPVLTKSGHLEGVVSIDDIVQAASGQDAPTPKDIVDALKAISAHRTVEA